jgi:hypothetical protein
MQDTHRSILLRIYKRSHADWYCDCRQGGNVHCLDVIAGRRLLDIFQHSLLFGNGIAAGIVDDDQFPRVLHARTSDHRADETQVLPLCRRRRNCRLNRTTKDPYTPSLVVRHVLAHPELSGFSQDERFYS